VAWAWRFTASFFELDTDTPQIDWPDLPSNTEGETPIKQGDLFERPA